MGVIPHLCAIVACASASMSIAPLTAWAFQQPKGVVTSSALSFSPTGNTGFLRTADDASSLLEASSTSLADDAEDRSRFYVCRYSGVHMACANRSYDGIEKGRYCPQKMCCSKTIVTYGKIGDFCTESKILCSSSLVATMEYSYGNCKQNKFKSKCPDNSEFLVDDRPLKGAYCQCKAGYIMWKGNCVPDLCSKNHCNPGTCVQNGNSTTCQCPKGYNQGYISANVQSCEESNICEDKQPCGDLYAAEKCTNLGGGKYNCTCASGYEFVEGKCRLVDSCKSAPLISW